MKSPSEEKTRRDRGRRAKTVNPSPQFAIPEGVELPEPYVLPDVNTKDRRSIHPIRKQQPRPQSKKGDTGER